MDLLSRTQSSKNESTLARLSMAKDNEDLVLAENSLQGERLVSIVRIATMVLLGLSQNLFAQVTGSEPIRDPQRGVALGLYATFAVGTFFLLRRMRPNARGATWGPLGFTIGDYGFYTFMGWRSAAVEGLYAPESGAAIFALLICFSVARFKSAHVAISTGLSCFCYMLLGMTFVPEHTQMHFFVLGILMALGMMIGLTQLRVRKMFLELRRRDMLTRFLPKQIADRVMTLGDTSLQPTQREVTVMFTDIRDFTTLSEALPPGVVLKFLDEYFGHMSAVVKGHEGIVNKFLGDGLLAFWGVPERLDDHAGKALRAALDMRRVVVELNEVRRRNGAPPIRIGIGVHTGTVAAGMLGGAEQHEYTVIGDAVNLTSRIEGLTKTYGVDVLVSEETWRQVDGRFSGERIGECAVKGRAEPVVVYRLLGLLPKSAAA